MSGKDMLRLLLISYGFCRNIEINTYTDGGWVGYDVSAENDDNLMYSECDCEGLLFHIYEINSFMRDNEVVPRIMSECYSTKGLLNDEYLNRMLSFSSNANYCKTNPYRLNKEK